MEPFLKQVAIYILTHHKDKVEKLCIILPSKRGAIYLKRYFSEVFQSAIWLPEIKSAEEFIEEISGLKQAGDIELLAMLYDSYLACIKTEPDSFDKFSRWGHLMLQDFNEIDRYLVNSDQIYTNLRNIKEIENWSLGEKELSPAQGNYIEFMSSIGAIYMHFQQQLIEKHIGYQGLLYRIAALNYKSSGVFSRYEKILFCGFNALNAAETGIYKWLYDGKKAEFLWDADTYYLENDLQESGIFLRRNLSVFPAKEPMFIGSNFREPKDIQIVAVAGQIGQAQLVHDFLKQAILEGLDLSKTAVVLANEKLLWPVLKLLPAEIEHVNITMEYPIRYTLAYSFLELIFQIQLGYEQSNRKTKVIYHKDFTALLQHPFFGVMLEAFDLKLSVHSLLNEIRDRNIVFITSAFIRNHFEGFGDDLISVITPWQNAVQGNAILKTVIRRVRDYYIGLFRQSIIHLEVEYLEILHKSLNQMEEVLLKYPHYNSMKAYRQLFLQTVGSSSVPFIGEPLKGLQIMGVLETRTLDFENLLMVGVNEGVLPSGKQINSFLPNDLKRVFGLPLYYEKDAIYAYHFYRLLQRAKHIKLIYDSETDEMGKGEKSRFITQLQYELKQYQPLHEITESVAVSSTPEFSDIAIRIPKNEITLREIIERAVKDDAYNGLSPSALMTYSTCSLKYYWRYGVGLREIKEVEENAEAGTFGTILHKVLETLYMPYLLKPLKEEHVSEMHEICDVVTENCFREVFSDEHDIKGKLLLQLEVLKVYAKKQLQGDKELIKHLAKNNEYLTVLHLEKEWQAVIPVKIQEKEQQVVIKGKIDRIDKCGEKIRILDYKTSVKTTDKFLFTSFDSLFENPDYHKQFQLFCYVWLLSKNQPDYLTASQPGIIPFKKYLSEPKCIYTGERNNIKPVSFHKTLMDEFEAELINFVSSVFDERVPFEQTNDLKRCDYCDYAAICNR
jgi:ATP-dependent helicase/nuclease subunit B